MVFPDGMIILFIVSLIFCAVGFYKFIWFLTVGYGLAIAAIGGALLFMAFAYKQFSLLYALQCLVLIVYGIRLGGFLFIRELKNANYRKKLAEAGGDAKVPVFVAILCWIFVAFLYICETSAIAYRLFNGLTTDMGACAIIGTLISIMGVYIEAVADKQKSEAKAIDPDMPAMQGLYKLCRCPNYFGEMVVWTGIFISGLMVYKGMQWVIGIIGYAGIIGIMLSGTKRVEARHIKYYGNKPEYNAYADSTPLLIPFVPFYHITSPEKIAKETEKKARKHG